MGNSKNLGIEREKENRYSVKSKISMLHILQLI